MREAYFFFAAVFALAAGFALADLAGLAAFLTVLAGAAFFVAIFRGSFREGLWVPVRKKGCLALVPEGVRQLEIATLYKRVIFRP